jgi:periplasmic divalent cation tolerance protein
MSEQYILVICSCPDDAVAGQVAGALVNERLAACVNRAPGVTSTYLWQGELQTDAEVLLLIKSSARLLAKLTQRIRELHPYEVPEVIAVPIQGGSEQYLAWLGQSLAPGEQHQ